MNDSRCDITSETQGERRRDQMKWEKGKQQNGDGESFGESFFSSSSSLTVVPAKSVVRF